MVCRCVQLVLPPVQEMHDVSTDASFPPHTTSLPPDRRERLCLVLGLGKSGTEHVSLGGGKISTEEPAALPPTTSCPEAQIVKDNVT